MKIGRVLVRMLGILILTALLSGCVSVYSGPRYELEEDEGLEAVVTDGVSVPLFYGFGTGRSEQAAREDALSDALQRAVFLALEDNGMLYRSQVERIFDQKVRLSDYILDSTVKVVDWDYEMGTYSVLLSSRILLGEISDLMRKNGIYGGRIADEVTLRLPDQEQPDFGSDSVLSEVLGDVGPAWQDGLKPTFLVYYDEEQVADPFTARTAVLVANEYLSSIGFPYIDLKQIESIKQDQDLAYSHETGESSMLRWIASKLHADYYIDLAVSTSTYSRGSQYYGEASVSLSCFDASTAAGRGSAFLQSQEPVEGSTRTAASDAAVARQVREGMQDVMSKASAYFTEDAKRGTSYEVVIIKPYNDKLLRSFQALLATKVGSITRTSYSVDEAQYSLVFSGTVDEVAMLVYESAEQFPEFSGIYLLYQRGNSLTFHSGM